MQQIRKDIQEFKMAHELDKVIIVWTANTERFCEILPGLNDTSTNILSSIRQNSSEISPSTLFAAASILENVSFIYTNYNLALSHKTYALLLYLICKE